MKISLEVLKTKYPAQTVLLKSDMGDEYSGFLTKTESGIPAVIFSWKAFYSDEVIPFLVSLDAAKKENQLFQIQFLVKALQSEFSNEVFIKDMNTGREIPVNLLSDLIDKKVYLLTHDIKPVVYKFEMCFADTLNGKLAMITRTKPVLRYLPPTGEKPINSIEECIEDFVFHMNIAYINHNVLLRLSGDINEQERINVLNICNKNGFKVVFEKE